MSCIFHLIPLWIRTELLKYLPNDDLYLQDAHIICILNSRVPAWGAGMGWPRWWRYTRYDSTWNRCWWWPYIITAFFKGHSNWRSNIKGSVLAKLPYTILGFKCDRQGWLPMYIFWVIVWFYGFMHLFLPLALGDEALYSYKCATKYIYLWQVI